MSVTITWDDGVKTASVTLSDDVLTSLEALRKTKVQLVSGAPAPIYVNVKQMILGEIYRTMILPALQSAPTTAVQTAKSQLESAQTAYDAALKGAVPNITS